MVPNEPRKADIKQQCQTHQAWDTIRNYNIKKIQNNRSIKWKMIKSKKLLNNGKS